MAGNFFLTFCIFHLCALRQRKRLEEDLRDFMGAGMSVRFLYVVRIRLLCIYIYRGRCTYILHYIARLGFILVTMALKE